MSRDYGELEREFIDGLAEDTGRDLGGWMGLINGQRFAHRNDMIDWLRQQGLTFAKASRLERIHHNGGKPLYGEKVIAKTLVETATAPAFSNADASLQPPISRKSATPPTTPQQPRPVAAPALAAPALASPDLEAYLAKAKGYRPLAELLIRCIRATAPLATMAVREAHVDLAAPDIFGAVAVTYKDVRLALALGDHPFEGDLKRLRLPGTGPALTHTIVVSDARRVDASLMALVLLAIKNVNS